MTMLPAGNKCSACSPRIHSFSARIRQHARHLCREDYNVDSENPQRIVTRSVQKFWHLCSDPDGLPEPSSMAILHKSTETSTTALFQWCLNGFGKLKLTRERLQAAPRFFNETLWAETTHRRLNLGHLKLGGNLLSVPKCTLKMPE